MSLIVSLLSRVKVNPETGCWEWTGRRHEKGYGKLRIQSGGSEVEYRAHRLCYEIAHGPIGSPEICVCHKCDNPPCINPDHLFLGDNQADTADMVAKRRHAFGESSGTHKLTERQVRDMRREFRHLFASLGEQHGVSADTIKRLIFRPRDSWSHVDP